MVRKTEKKKQGRSLSTRQALRTEKERSGPRQGGAVAAGRRVLRTEIDGLARLSESLGQNLEQAIGCLMAVTGRVIVAGIGKSGHVARKVAATLASTGTPAHFVHPSEASHGDLGMIARGDAVLILSNSGNSPELADIVSHCRRQNIPLIAISAGAESTLIRHADIALLLPVAAEACPMGLAPTTSTTQMIALGDVIAVALMERRGFTSADYRDLHPGGALGKALLRVGDIMHRDAELPLVHKAMAMGDVLLVMTAKSFGCAGVTDGGGRLVGIITDGDLRRHMNSGLLARTAADIMTPHPKLLRESELLADALRTFNDHGIMCAFVIGDDDDPPARPVGFVHMHDCLRAGAA
jgi:arabinose-5-phosphate isomerase